MTGTGMNRAEAERLWRTAYRAEDRLDMVERALAAIGRPRRADSENLNSGRK